MHLTHITQEGAFWHFPQKKWHILLECKTTPLVQWIKSWMLKWVCASLILSGGDFDVVDHLGEWKRISGSLKMVTDVLEWLKRRKKDVAKYWTGWFLSCFGSRCILFFFLRWICTSCLLVVNLTFDFWFLFVLSSWLLHFSFWKKKSRKEDHLFFIGCGCRVLLLKILEKNRYL